MNIKRVIISGGGTGGHIFPALAIANEIGKRYPDAEILFVGALGRMEMEKIPAAGYKIIGLPVMGFPRKPGFKTIIFFIRLLKSAAMARKIIKEFKPQIAIGVGGFASGPLLRAASNKKIPTLIQEQNSYAGITNKLLGKRVDSICVAYDKMESYFPAKKIVFTGNPFREILAQKIQDKKVALDYFGLKGAEKVILIIGGSLGARSINNAVLKNIEKIAQSGVKVIWQTGAIYFGKIQDKIKGGQPGNLQIHQFISRMDLAYSVASLVISRAGAGTISELCLIGKTAILVPSPNVAEDHQTKNALSLVEKKAAIIVKDNEIDEKLFNVAFGLINDPEKCKQLSEKIKLLAKHNATNNIVDEVEKLIQK
ncbi:MAG: undecaprenyldiphospho-muramoylpentapeptide beta-N-acetylglucosaminyltransferase [Prolixibacteraceae bacterium]|jgi:UDP-N-acetylglucosamine--N-acetylmuramyl-(pentapeptide) pyrophosphoryl-undecaprenol N-acetylglucosamine transferase|nr:undecaprenyldiphospho-muramoylpentapeptide beta-N-acetylglucosaminyltransferase [Prolixibacteraceae bacterium]MBT6006277.1 undecaprenyldiphospho-muramoylpentapeptide beta-N-acetylglucosaminyltransferase [Prolixibacteraceae bacterium]MBT6997467.1 undecaprenyldiphospho-muramoylpentapeptide beta-N-acetylglucosaminyltransferase [Prolixibacteraceae bacterium]MBT7395579.1 undecaprenyldiphospho-muramoylpentapeptide beta-N-acetylglucosaminyltransferase [Prolixibacteraceae bacterium]